MKCECLYMINRGNVGVFDRYNNFLVSYVPGGYFGDFQVILQCKSQFAYRAVNKHTNHLFSINSKTFIKLLTKDSDAFMYLTKYALKRRKFLRSLSK